MDDLILVDGANCESSFVVSSPSPLCASGVLLDQYDTMPMTLTLVSH